MSQQWNATQPVRQGEELDTPRLEAYLKHQWPAATGSLTVTQFPGGHSNLTYLVQLGEREMVLRRPPFGNQVKTAHDMAREYRVLSKLSPVYQAAPQPLLYCDDETVLGAPFYLMERRHGLILRRRLPPGLHLDPPTMRRLGEAVIENLAHLHRIDYEAIGLGDLGRPEGYAQRQVSGWTKRYENVRTDDLPEIEQLAEWLGERIPSESGASLVHNDYKYDNLILDPADLTRIVGVLDWEMCTIGDPLMDFGTALAYWVQADDHEVIASMGVWGPTALPGSLTRQEVADYYAARTGRDLSQLLFYYCFGLFKIAVIIQQIYYRYVKGFTRDERFARLNQSVATLSKTAVRAIEAGRF